MKKMLVFLAVLMTFVSANAFALTYTIEDNWINWPGYEDTAPYPLNTMDEIGSPEIDYMSVDIDETSNLVQAVRVQFRSDSRLRYDSLFINVNDYSSNWDSWDYFVIEKNDINSSQRTIGNVADSGLYSVLPDYQYTFVGDGVGRDGNPNGIDVLSLDLISASFLPVYDSSTFTLSYDLSALQIDITDGLFLAYSPYCANDVIGGPAVPEPGSLLLLGGGLVGLAYLRKRKKV